MSTNTVLYCTVPVAILNCNFLPQKYFQLRGLIVCDFSSPAPPPFCFIFCIIILPASSRSQELHKATHSPSRGGEHSTVAAHRIIAYISSAVSYDAAKPSHRETTSRTLVEFFLWTESYVFPSRPFFWGGIEKTAPTDLVSVTESKTPASEQRAAVPIPTP